MSRDELLRRVEPSEITIELAPPVDEETLQSARDIVRGVREGGVDRVRAYAERFGERQPGEPLMYGRDAMREAYDSLDSDVRGCLERVHERIRAFALAQREAVLAVDVPVPGGRAGHTIEPIQAAGCYAPAGRYPLPSSVLMTAATARAAGCARVVVASPGKSQVMLAASYVAGADEYLAVGGAHGIAALAFGFDGFEPVDKIVGPGNRWVTAAKQIVSDRVGIDMLAGPSELVVLADETADPAIVAADLLAQAEHDADARACLVTTSQDLVMAVESELRLQLEQLSTREVAADALRNGYACVTNELSQAINIVNTLAPEHLEIMTKDPHDVAHEIRHAGAVFIGQSAAEVLGDYGIGPNHTLPTGRTARHRGGLSVMDFLRFRTWVRIEDDAAAQPVMRDTMLLANVEGLDAHARSAAIRAKCGSTRQGG